MFRKLGMFDRSLGMFQPPGSIPFQPGQLFAAGEQGVWYDPSDFSTMFQDAAGTTPVTAIEQPVGLILDKSKGFVFGPELVTNGTFNTGTTGWTAGFGTATSTFTASGGVATLTQAGTDTTPRFVTTITGLTIGKVYKVSAEKTGGSGSGDRYLIFASVSNGTGGSAKLSGGTSGTDTIIASATATTMYVALNVNGFAAGGTQSWDNISVKELSGNYAYQSTTTSRPILRNLYNLLTQTEDFSNAVWASTFNGVTKSVNAITDQATTAYHGIYYTSSLTAATSYTVSFKVKKGTVQYIVLGFFDTAALNCGAGFNLNSGTVTGTGAIGAGYSATNARVVDAGGGVYICSVDCTQPSTTNYPTILHRSTAYVSGSIAESYLGVITNTTTIYTASLVPANEASLPYQRVVTNTLGSGVYDTDLTKFKPYLAFDGTDDWLQTANIDFSATDKMSVFAGVRKLSDETSILFETSVAWDNNNGSIGVTINGSNYSFACRGTSIGYYRPTTYTAPITNVLSVNYNIAGTSLAQEIFPRINGVLAQSGEGGTNVGTGNFGNYPLYIGRRAGTTFPFNGHIYSFLVRGALTSSPQLEQTESWINSKTGAY